MISTRPNQTEMYILQFVNKRTTQRKGSNNTHKNIRNFLSFYFESIILVFHVIAPRSHHPPNFHRTRLFTLFNFFKSNSYSHFAVVKSCFQRFNPIFSDQFCFPSKAVIKMELSVGSPYVNTFLKKKEPKIFSPIANPPPSHLRHRSSTLFVCSQHILKKKETVRRKKPYPTLTNSKVRSRSGIFGRN